MTGEGGATEGIQLFAWRVGLQEPISFACAHLLLPLRRSLRACDTEPDMPPKPPMDSLSRVITALKEAKRIIVVSGAGVSLAPWLAARTGLTLAAPFDGGHFFFFFFVFVFLGRARGARATGCGAGLPRAGSGLARGSGRGPCRGEPAPMPSVPVRPARMSRSGRLLFPRSVGCENARPFSLYSRGSAALTPFPAGSFHRCPRPAAFPTFDRPTACTPV